MTDESQGEAVGRRALSKASLRLLPLIGLGYGIAYMDRANIGYAALQMSADLRFSATVYGLGAGLFFLNYALMEVPSNLMLLRFGARRWIAEFLGPYAWGLAKDHTGNYHAGLLVLCVTYAVAALIVMVLRRQAHQAPAGLLGVAAMLAADKAEPERP